MSSLIVIAGLSGGGKTTAANIIAEGCSLIYASRQEDITHIASTDNCYRDFRREGLTDEQRDALCFNPNLNFDHPDSIDKKKLTGLIDGLTGGRDFEYLGYQFNTHSYRDDQERYHHVSVPSPLIFPIFEGILALNLPELTERAAIQIYANSPPEIALMRRVLRDSVERGRNPLHALKQMEETVIPMQNAYLLPKKQDADLTVNCYQGDVRELRDSLAREFPQEQYPEMRVVRKIQQGIERYGEEGVPQIVAELEAQTINEGLTKGDMTSDLYTIYDDCLAEIFHALGMKFTSLRTSQKLPTIERIVSESFDDD